MSFQCPDASRQDGRLCGELCRSRSRAHTAERRGSAWRRERRAHILGGNARSRHERRDSASKRQLIADSGTTSERRAILQSLGVAEIVLLLRQAWHLRPLGFPNCVREKLSEGRISWHPWHFTLLPCTRTRGDEGDIAVCANTLASSSSKTRTRS